MREPASPRRFTGWHMTAIMVAFFGVVVAVNLTMARLASKSFGGVVVDNSYVASQKFNTWLSEARNEKTLGWKVSASRQTGNRIALELAGLPPGPVSVSAVARHPLGVTGDQTLHFDAAGISGVNNQLVSRESLPAGRWRLRLTVNAQGQEFRAEQEVQ